MKQMLPPERVFLLKFTGAQYSSNTSATPTEQTNIRPPRLLFVGQINCLKTTLWPALNYFKQPNKSIYNNNVPRMALVSCTCCRCWPVEDRKVFQDNRAATILLTGNHLSKHHQRNISGDCWNLANEREARTVLTSGFTQIKVISFNADTPREFSG